MTTLKVTEYQRQLLTALVWTVKYPEGAFNEVDDLMYQLLEGHNFDQPVRELNQLLISKDGEPITCNQITYLGDPPLAKQE